MSETSKIEWTDATWNPTRGCTKIATGCKNCYAETFAERWRGIAGHPYEQGFDPRVARDQLTAPTRWKKPRRVFVNSMSDLFHEAFSFAYIAQVFGVMAKANWHTYQILTKRTERAAEFLNEYAAGGRHVWTAAQAVSVPDSRYASNPSGWPLPNVWLGTSISTQADADANIPHLLRIPTAVRFLSAEPLLGPIEFSDVSRRADAVSQLGKKALSGIDWIIAGGESGPKARACNVAWIRAIVQQCRTVGVPAFVKQLGAKPFDSEWHGDGTPAGSRMLLNSRKGNDPTEWPADLRVRQMPEPRA